MFSGNIDTPVAGGVRSPAVYTSCVLIRRLMAHIGEVRLSTPHASGILPAVLVVAELLTLMTLQDARSGTFWLHSNFHVP